MSHSRWKEMFWNEKSDGLWLDHCEKESHQLISWHSRWTLTLESLLNHLHEMTNHGKAQGQNLDAFWKRNELDSWTTHETQGWRSHCWHWSMGLKILQLFPWKALTFEHLWIAGRFSHGLSCAKCVPAAWSRWLPWVGFTPCAQSGFAKDSFKEAKGSGAVMVGHVTHAQHFNFGCLTYLTYCAPG